MSTNNNNTSDFFDYFESSRNTANYNKLYKSFNLPTNKGTKEEQEKKMKIRKAFQKSKVSDKLLVKAISCGFIKDNLHTDVVKDLKIRLKEHKIDIK